MFEAYKWHTWSNFAVNPVTLNLLHAFCRLIDRLEYFIKSSFIVIEQTSSFSSSFTGLFAVQSSV